MNFLKTLAYPSMIYMASKYIFPIIYILLRLELTDSPTDLSLKLKLVQALLFMNGKIGKKKKGKQGKRIWCGGVSNIQLVRLFKAQAPTIAWQYHYYLGLSLKAFQDQINFQGICTKHSTSIISKNHYFKSNIRWSIFTKTCTIQRKYSRVEYKFYVSNPLAYLLT